MLGVPWRTRAGRRGRSSERRRDRFRGGTAGGVCGDDQAAGPSQRVVGPHQRAPFQDRGLGGRPTRD
ncbi:MAG: hypothetical protein R6U96_18495 [Promethearchaeia archaeon]